MVSVIPHKTRSEPVDEPTMGTKLPFPAGHRTRGVEDEPRPRTAFVLSGGGNQGVSQVGMLRALLERGIVPDVVIGTSAGALNGAAVAYAAMKVGVPARIFVPAISSPAKQARIRQYGADLMVVGERYAEALAASQQWAAESGALQAHCWLAARASA